MQWFSIGYSVLKIPLALHRRWYSFPNSNTERTANPKKALWASISSSNQQISSFYRLWSPLEYQSYGLKNHETTFRANISTGYKILEHMDNFSMLLLMLKISKISKLRLIENGYQFFTLYPFCSAFLLIEL